jgi:ATP-dependent DNA helicase RecQ
MKQDDAPIYPTERLQELLQTYWGHAAFRPGQEAVIHSVLSGHDTLALMPTGGGKSLCYQLPALLLEGLCLVVSPLIALMKDQVESLRRKNITAFALYAGMGRREVMQTLKVASESNCRFLYVSPERLETALFREYLPGLPIRLIAVDEAHCISQWGYDFRPPYLRIAALREELPDVPVLALTASATPAVQKDICERLLRPGTRTAHKPFAGWRVYRQSFERPQLSYSVFKTASKPNKIREILENVPGSAIIYCRSRKKTREISELLTLHGLSASYYHAGLTADERQERQEAWTRGRIRVITCTNAFGMGIDKPDVRVVIHADPPDCLENYYQEAGRAGRDGHRSYAVLLYDARDLEELDALPEQRFPSDAEIRETYQALANYLQIPAGSGQGEYRDFDLQDFLKKFQADGTRTLNVLRILEQEGLLTFNEQLFLPATVGFTTGKEYLYEYEKSHPDQEPLIKSLLRSYAGIFDMPVPISEKQLARLLRVPAEQISLQLRQLQQTGIIEYRPQKDRPQLFFPVPRLRTENLRPDRQALTMRKKVLTERITSFCRYITEPAQCRARYIASYFGDTSVRACGICDHCQKQRSTSIDKAEFDQLRHRLLNLVKYESMPVSQIPEKLGGVDPERIWKVIEFLLAEQVLTTDASGNLRLH